MMQIADPYRFSSPFTGPGGSRAGCLYKVSRLAVLFALCTAAHAQGEIVALKPSRVVSANFVAGYPNAQRLYADVSAVTAGYVESQGESVLSSFTLGYAEAPAGEVRQVEIAYRGMQTSSSGSIRVKLYDGDSLLVASPVHELSSEWKSYSDTFREMHIVNANNLRTVVEFDNTSYPPRPSLRCSDLQIRVSVAPPFVVFAASPRGLQTILEKYLTASDYISAAAAQADVVLGTRIPKMNQFALPGSTLGVAAGVKSYKAIGMPGLIVYDVEHWTATPLDEQRDPAVGIAAAAQIAHQNGLRFGIAPDGQYIGLPAGSCKHNLNSGLYKDVDWQQIDYLNIQAQRDLSNRCGGADNITDYIDFVTSLTTFVRAKNPHIVVSAQLSFRYTSPETMNQAVDRLVGVVDGFYLAFPLRAGEDGMRSEPACTYCKPDALEKLLNNAHFKS